MTQISLSERAERERLFHNKWACGVAVEELPVRECFEAPTAIENHFILKRFGNVKGRKILDLGCGAGESSVYFALQGAEVCACDVAEGFLSLAQHLAERHNVRIQTRQADAAALPFPENSFDLVYGNGVLHHVELKGAFREIHRVLKGGGAAAFIEPLAYNPLIYFYRWMAREVRTLDERPLNFSALKNACAPFSHMEHEEFWFLTLLVFADFYLIKRWHPSKVRYWKRVLEDTGSFGRLFERLKRWDEKILRMCPFLKPLCWNTVLILRK